MITLALTPQQIQTATRALKEQRPAYTPMLDFYEQVFMAQQDSRKRLSLEPRILSEDILALKAKEKFPLINLNQFIIDTDASETLFKQTCEISQTANEDISASTKIILKAIDKKELDVETLFLNLLEGKDDFFVSLAKSLQIDKAILAFISYISIQPSLIACAEQLSTYLDSDAIWDQGYCPICGNLPCLSLLEDEGKRSLFCSFCWHQWTADRIYCPFCNTKKKEMLSYFYSDEEPEYRVDLCDHCQKYIKTVDARKTERIIYPPLEQISTLHLDMQAQEKGFESSVYLLI
jgi:FdhE protein